MKRVISILISFILIVSMIPFAASADEVREFIEIRTAEDLYNVNSDLKGCYILMNDIDLSDVTADGGTLDFEGRGWDPLGSAGIYSGDAFTGIFDGNGHEISGLRMNIDSLPKQTNGIKAGLFGYNAGIIKDLTVSGSISVYDVTGLSYIGAIAGYNTGTVENCASEVEISGDVDGGYSLLFVSGIAGESSGTISKCYNNGDVSIITGSYDDYLIVSGIANTYRRSSLVENCYNTGNITATDVQGGPINSSGLCGIVSGELSNSYNVGKAEYAVSKSDSGISGCYYLRDSGEGAKGAKALSSSQMECHENFREFDFDSVWFIDNECEYKYPQLTDNRQISTAVPSEKYTPSSSDGIYEIYTVRDLAYVSSDPDADYILMNDLDLSEATAEGGDYDFEGRGWDPIGSLGTYDGIAFSGTFDGNGYEISGLRINIDSLPEGTNGITAGLFANNDGIIKNLTVSGNISISSVNGLSYIGSIAGYNTGTIENCAGKMNITGNVDDSYTLLFVSGITGESTGTVSKCYNNGDISVNTSSVNDYLIISGIANTYRYTSVLSDCYNTGNLSAADSENNIMDSSGICGIVSGSLCNSYNTGNARYAVSKSSLGISDCYYLKGSGIGSNGSKALSKPQMEYHESFRGFDFDSTWFIDCECEYKYPQLTDNRQIKSASPSEKYTPDLVDGTYELYSVRDLAYIGTEPDADYRLMNDLDLSEVTAEGGDYDYNGQGWCPIGSDGIYGDEPFTGTFDGNGFEISGLRIDVSSVDEDTDEMYTGLFGFNEGVIKDLSVSGTVNVSAAAEESYIGGIVGYNTGMIENCSNKTEITSETDENVNLIRVSGIAGESTGTIKKCYNSGNITAVVSDETNIAVSGIANQYQSSAVIIDCYNTGDVKASDLYDGKMNSSGICAYAEGTLGHCYNVGNAKYAISEKGSAISECYYLSGTGNGISGAKSLTSGLMKIKSSYTGFDFDSTWFITREGDYPYPQLKSNPMYEYEISSIEISLTDIVIDVDETFTLSVSILPEYATTDRTIEWSSSDDTVAAVDDSGTVTALKAGTVTIKASSANGKTSSCEVTVLSPITKLEFEEPSFSVARGNSEKLGLIIEPSDTTDTLFWSVSDSDIAEVDQNGNVTGKKVGETTVTVTSSREKTVTCELTVTSPATAVVMSSGSENLFAGQQVQLYATLTPYDVTDSVTWTSSDESIVYVSDDGLVTALAQGEAVITVTADSGVYDVCNISVESNISSADIYLEYDSTVYSGSKNEPSVSVYYNDKQLVKDTDYSVEYLDNTDAGSAKVIVRSLTDDSVTTKEFVILPFDINFCNVVFSESVEYTGQPVESTVSITYNDMTLERNVDYTLKYSNNISAGNASVLVSGIGNYSGFLSRSFEVTPKSLSDFEVELDTSSYVYDKTEKTPSVTVSDGSITLVKGKDYTCSYSDNINAGTAKVTVSGTGNYCGSIDKSFEIERKPVDDLVIGMDASSHKYEGKEIRPAVSVYDGADKLIKDTDYSVTYSNNINVGEAAVIINGTGNYTGKIELSFEIIPRPLTDLEIVIDQNEYTYDGEEKKPDVSVTHGSVELTENTDYEVSYKNNINAGTASVIVSGINNYSSDVTVEFKILPKSVKELNIEADTEGICYDGSEKKPEVTVSDGDTVLTVNKDYTLSYKSNINAGKAKICVSGINNYCSDAEVEFDILPKSVKELDIEADTEDIYYDGSEKKPDVIVKDGDKVLTPDEDYTLRYESNVEVGTAKIYVTGINNYSDEEIITFEIKPYIVLGDVDGDKIVTIMDASFIQLILAKMATEKNKESADVDGDGFITVTDATYIQSYLSNLPVPFPIGKNV